MATDSCPSREQLMMWVSGGLMESAADKITVHLDECPDCEALTDHLQSEVTLVDASGQRQDPFSREQGCRDLVNRLLVSFADGPSSGGPAVSLGVSAEIRDYELLEYLGGGGMGQVYRARHIPLNRFVAVKLLPEDSSADSQLIERFSREIRAVGSLQHPNIVQAFDAGESGGRWFLAMELLDGTDLSVLQRNHAVLSVADACEIIRRAALGLQYAHEKGFVHRDIKPANLMLTRDADGHVDVKVTDLGLALAMADDGRRQLTDDGQLMGTLEFMAPEQAEKAQVDHKADIYSLGATLYRLLTGYAPFEGDSWRTPAQRLLALTTSTPPAATERRSDIPPDLAQLLNSMLRRDPADRPIDMKTVAGQLQPFCKNHQLASVWQRGSDLRSRSSHKADQKRETIAAAVASFPEAVAIDNQTKNSHSKTTSVTRRVALWTVIGLLLFAGIWLRTEGGYIRIQHDPSVDIAVQVVRDGQPIDSVELTSTHDTVWYRSGQYEIRIPSEMSDRLEVVNGTFHLTRGQKHVVTIQKVSEPDLKSAGNTLPVNATNSSESVVAISLPAEHQQRREWSAPEWLGGDINSEWKDDEPTLTEDGLTMIFSSYCQPRVGGQGDRDLWVTHRSDLSAPWGPVRNLSSNINSSMKESHPSISGDGRTLVFASNRRRGFGGTDLWVSFRKSVDDDWSEPQNLGGGVNSEFEDSEPELAADQLTLFFASNRPGGFGGDDLFFCRRPTKESAWEPPQLLPAPVNSELADHGPALSPDQCLLIFSSDRPGGYGQKDLWIVRRATTDDPWSPPLNLGPEINSQYRECHPAVSAGGRILVFASDRPVEDELAGSSDTDLFVSHRLQNPSEPQRRSTVTSLVPRAASEDPPSINQWPFTPEQAAATQQRWAEYLQIPQQFSSDIGITFRLIPPGEFLMGATEAEAADAMTSLTESRPHKINETLEEQ
ncbi:MAG: serine/threonine-protein kinase, partial [Planctomycetaceae bacterium]|nr:serine/threonine-protein kinase [Planctomycetaceae bacterium]